MHTVLVSLILVLSLGLSGCTEYVNWHGRSFYGVDCSHDAVAANNGKCVYLKDKKGTGNAQTARP